MQRDKSGSYNLTDMAVGEVLRLTVTGKGWRQMWNGKSKWTWIKMTEYLEQTRGLVFEIRAFEFEVWIVRMR